MSHHGWSHETEGLFILGLSLAAALTTGVLVWLLPHKRDSQSAPKQKKYSQRLMERFAKRDAFSKGAGSGRPGKTSGKHQ